MSSSKVQVVVIDHKRKRKTLEGSGTIVTEWPFSAYVLQNPAISGHADTEEEAVNTVRRALVLWNTREPGETRKVVDLDIGDEIVVRDVMES